MIEFTIDGNRVRTEKGRTILEESEKLGIKIPTLCHHKTLTPSGSCRLCIVEVTKGKRTRIVTSCNYPVEEGISVETETNRILQHRRLIMEFLLARCPEVPVLKDLAGGMGVTKTRFKKEDKDCILCGLCVRVCHEIIKAGAIDLVSRGTEEDVDTPFKSASESCIGCGACASLCPTGAIKVEDIKKERGFARWHTSLPLKKCRLCGKVIAPNAQIAYLRKKIELPDEIFETCADCKRKRYGRETVALTSHTCFQAKGEPK